MRGGVDSDFAARSLGLTELPRISTQEWHSEHVVKLRQLRPVYTLQL